MNGPFYTKMSYGASRFGDTHNSAFTVAGSRSAAGYPNATKIVPRIPRIDSACCFAILPLRKGICAMAVLGLLLILVFFVGPILLAGIALTSANRTQDELKRLRDELQKPSGRERTEAPGRREENPALPSLKIELQPAPKPAEPPPPPAPTPPRPPVQEVARPKPGRNMEFLMGGKAAAFAGIAVLVTGIVFLVGYAIQHAWIGPGARIVLGLLCGGALVGGGHVVELKDTRLRLLARVLTGGGSALFYFSVFAAYGIYHLIGPVGAGLGLFASALAVVGLAMAYRSQAVGVLGVLGAFITPLLIGGNMQAGAFPLVYVAVINVPVLLLGVRRRWQLLYNLAFVFTVFHFLAWLKWIAVCEVWVGLGFAVLYFAEYAALGLLKLRSEPQVGGRTADIVRLVLSSLLLLGSVTWLMDEAGANDWTGTALLILALVHTGLARIAFKILPRFTADLLTFLAGGLAFAALALPVQLDGGWVSLGWAIEGAALAWFAARVQSRPLQAGAFLLGLVSLLKALLFDIGLYEDAPRLFLNVRFAAGMLSAALLGVQGRFAGRFSKDDAPAWQDALGCSGVVGALLIFFTDAFWTLGEKTSLSWLITSLMLLATGAASFLLAPRKSAVVRLGVVLILLVPAKLLLDAIVGIELFRTEHAPFLNIAIWLQLAMVAGMILVLQPRLARRIEEPRTHAAPLARLLNLMALGSGIGVTTIEILHSRSDWASTGVTILWSGCALALILFGMRRRVAAHRYFGLILFGLATFKVLIVDSAELRGLERIAAFIGTGLLLLILSFAYQKASAHFQALGEEP